MSTKNTTSRPGIVFGETPMLIWNIVPEATYYQFKIQKENKIIWNIEINELEEVDEITFECLRDGRETPVKPPKAQSYQKYAICDYPEDTLPLERSAPLVFTGLAQSGEGIILQEFQTELFIGEENLESAQQNTSLPASGGSNPPGCRPPSRCMLALFPE
ncbi:hypothetical protein [Gloeocapsa sp. PCC 73106]|uniref:hypothetical protein n=1 Tax=Gloeocapsa sp. PCC 73106 TaxID=102232 RepID=UPI0002ABF568|nr:hypothetical protein [Gloeocapsa sp. PCC 73106]ELR99020.1 hypothetical protein GLO73106DRAFT_00028640 [Gloeocapsa sp. PCC 73106]